MTAKKACKKTGKNLKNVWWECNIFLGGHNIYPCIYYNWWRGGGLPGWSLIINEANLHKQYTRVGAFSLIKLSTILLCLIINIVKALFILFILLNIYMFNWNFTKSLSIISKYQQKKVKCSAYAKRNC